MDPNSKEYSPAQVTGAAGVPAVTFQQWRGRYGLLKDTTVRYSLLDTSVARAAAVLSSYSFRMDEVVALANGRLREQLGDILRERVRGKRLGIIVRLFESKEGVRPATVVWLDLNTITDHVIDYLKLDLPIKRLSNKERAEQLKQVLAYLETPVFASRVEALRELWHTAGPQSWWTISTMLGVPYWLVQLALSPDDKKAKPPLRPIVNKIARDVGFEPEQVTLQ